MFLLLFYYFGLTARLYSIISGLDFLCLFDLLACFDGGLLGNLDLFGFLLIIRLV